MTDFDSADALLRTGAGQLSRILGFEEAASAAWNEEDLAAMLRHQWSAPLAFDLKTVELSPPQQATREETLGGAAASEIKTFGDLFQHPHPPLALLKLAKDFFKAGAGSGTRRLPEQEVAYTFYLLTILVARLRLKKPITRLADDNLLAAIQWALRRQWLNAPARDLFVLAQEHLKAGPPP
jgi:hypothetical protein